ncbi:NUDIX domain-containing protein [Stieleria sp. TO1_6]|uniref:NUDIX domain-containing protein n=1 Tax=Stieleria tagensis TaxID=2956795 RepID=UPI00209AC754|nr:NUDIX domain-containing protein [Stieleria tagensis]MCO8124247.1 NUDIX domain-containing protein [Stieleria tagensis]
MSEPSPKPLRQAAGILLLTRQKPVQFLLMRHTDRWDLPKGHCESGESMVETARRETEEETGISADAITIDPDFRFELRYDVTYKRNPGQVFEKQVLYLIGEIESAVTPRLTEHESFQWFDWNPPHTIQSQTIDPLLQAVAIHLAARQSSDL